MKKSMIAGIALAAGVAIAAPTLVSFAAEDQPQIAQSEPDQHGMGGMDGMMGEHGFRGHEGREGMGHHGWMREMMTRRTPQQRCEERLAHRAGIIAYTVSKLNLTAEQKPLWDKLSGIIQTSADKERQLCANQPAQAGPQAQGTILDRMGRREQFLSVRLQTLQQARPALEALYQALTPEQKAIIDHPFRR